MIDHPPVREQSDGHRGPPRLNADHDGGFLSVRYTRIIAESMRGKDIVPRSGRSAILFHVKPVAGDRADAAKPRIMRRVRPPPAIGTAWHDIKTASSAIGRLPRESWWSSP